MKSSIIYTSIIALLMASTVMASTVVVTFRYPEASNADIAGFRLMRDGVLDTDNVLPTVRTFTTTRPEDAKDHSYVLIAVGKYGQLAESTPFVLKWVAPAIPKPTYLNLK
jgi:hypothetical protein